MNCVNKNFEILNDMYLVRNAWQQHKRFLKLQIQDYKAFKSIVLSGADRRQNRVDIFNIYTDVKSPPLPILLSLIFQFHPHRTVQLNNKISCQGNILPERKREKSNMFRGIFFLEFPTHP